MIKSTLNSAGKRIQSDVPGKRTVTVLKAPFSHRYQRAHLHAHSHDT